MTERTLTALFDDKDAAKQAEHQLQDAGVSASDIRITSQEEHGSDHTSWWDGLKTMFSPSDEDKHAYSEHIRRGGYLLTARVREAQADRAIQVLENSGAVDFDRRQEEWRGQGWQDRPAGAQSGLAAATEGRTGSDRLYDQTDGQVGAQGVSIQRGGAGYAKDNTSAPVSADDDVFRDREIEMTETSEEAVVAKEARVREELLVTKTSDQRTETLSDTVRHTEVDVQNLGEQGRSSSDAQGVAGAAMGRDLGETRSFAPTDIREHAQVVGSDGQLVGSVDHVDGGSRIKLARHDSADGQHHYIPLDWVDDVQGDQVRLRVPASQAQQQWTAAG